MAKVVASKYQLGDCIGKGGFGAVYKGLNIETGEYVAVKRISLKKVPKEEVMSIKSEINLLKQLNHPNITKYVDHHISKDELFIIMEFVENGSLQGVVKKFGKFPESLVGLYVAQVLEGLAFLHSEGVIHRDIKGANILTTKAGVIKLADFGVASKLSEIEPDSVVGTPYWMAPEIIELNPPQYASDIWSLGSTVIELLDGNPPYYELPAMTALFRIVQDDHPPLPSNISPLLKDFLMQCFQKDPNLRPGATQLLKHKWITNSRRKSVQNSTIDDDYATIKMHNKAKPERIALDNLFSTEKGAAGAIPGSTKSKLKTISPTDVMLPVATRSSVQNKLAKFSEAANEEEDNDLDWGDSEALQPLKKTSVSTSAAVGPKGPSTGGSHRPLSGVHLRQPSLVSEGSSSSLRSGAGAMSAKSTQPAPRDEDDYDDILMDDGEAPKLQEKLRAKLKMRTIGPDEVREPLYSSGGSNLAKFSEFEEDADFDEVEEDLVVNASAVELGERLKRRFEDIKDQEDSQLLHDGFSFQEREEVDFDALPDLDVKAAGTSGQDSTGAAEDDDPFAAISAQDEVESKGAQDYEQLGETVMRQIWNLTLKSQEDTVLNSCAILLKIFQDYPEQKHQLITHHGIVPILELLDLSVSSRVHLALLRVLNQIASEDVRFKENLCLMGVLPAILKFAQKEHSLAVRAEAAIFVNEMCHTSNLTLQMFIACRGLPVLAQLMDRQPGEDYHKMRQLVLSAIDCTMQVFHVQGRTPKNDFARVFVRAGIALRLSEALISIVSDTEGDGRYREVYADKIATIFLIFSQGDHVVKTDMGVEPVLRNVLSIMDVVPVEARVKLLKCAKNLSMDPNVLDPMQRTGYIPKLVQYLSVAVFTSATSSVSEAFSGSMSLPNSAPNTARGEFEGRDGSMSARPSLAGSSLSTPPSASSSASSTQPSYRASDIQNQVLMALYNLCRINKSRQEIAAESGIIPCLQRIIVSNSPLNQFALPMICDLAHASKRCLNELWKYDSVSFYLRLLKRQYWQTNALESIAVWISTDSSERKRVESVLRQPDNVLKFVSAFWTKDYRTFAGMVIPMSKILQSSPVVAEALSMSDFVNIIVRKLQEKQQDDPQVRLRLLSMLEAMYASSKNPKKFILQHHLMDLAKNIMALDKKIMVREQAKNLLQAFESNQVL